MKFPPKQGGMTLIMLLFIVGLAAIGYIVHSLDPALAKVNRDKNTAEVLLEAKAALIGWSVSHSQFPGILPFPDRSSDGNYDGNSDCVSSATLTYTHLIGKLPYLAQTSPCVGASQYGISTRLIDGYGEHLWYAVSRNLIRTSVAAGSLIVNPLIVNAPTYPWMIVRDKNGQVISDRVAAVIIAPGLPLGAQDRADGLAGPAAYLDSMTISGVSYSNADDTIPDEEFIMGEDMQYVTSTHPTYQQPYQFNDKLIYITIDELILALEKRVIREAAQALRTYYLNSAVAPTSRFYPYAAILGDANNLCDEGRLMGGLPINNAASTCTHLNPGLSTLPLWFTESRWQDSIYYVISNDCSFAVPGCALGGVTIGGVTNVDAALISTGFEIGAQLRPSNNAQDYLDSIENANGDFIFDAIGTPLTNAYNDQMLIVAQ